MKWVVASVCVLLAASCAPAPEVRLSAEDQLGCSGGVDGEGVAHLTISTFNGACSDYGGSEKIRGVFFWGFEETRFAEGLSRLPERRPDYVASLFVDNEDVSDELVFAPEWQNCDRVVYLEFYGRRAIRSYGLPRDGEQIMWEYGRNAAGERSVREVVTTTDGRKQVRELSKDEVARDVEVILVEKVLRSDFLGYVERNFGSGMPIERCKRAVG